MTDTVTLSIKQAEKLSLAVLEAGGFSHEHASAIMRSVIAAQIDECHSHGLYRLIGCVQTARNGGLDTHVLPEIMDQAPAITRINAHKGCSLLSFEKGLPFLIEKARHCGISVLAINNSFHFSALWPEVEQISAHGLVGMAMTPTHAFVAPAGGTKPLLGTNPIAFSWPRPGKNPYTFDFATSVIARGEIELHRRAGKEIPEDWAIDENGQPTTDATKALAGAMLTFGGHKGSALSTMIGLLAGPLIGDVLGHETHAASEDRPGNPHHGEIIIAFAPETFLGEEAQKHLDHAEELFERIIEQGARLPSQRRFEARERSRKNGVTIPKALHDELSILAEAV
ncbi:Ldh family oxidoreductase [Thalassospira xiamenensis]|uniref:Malate/lactate/ureidoglycolate dehydrogenase, LDH2 family n=1 Tax=Thalassospira xiamenensis TaxID=220697 RepID=A0A285T6W0_9PROT|nr:Ldh family oxidoreductase [Thalassospira xiamenensis]SOC15283.1 Malate/lactate/ureidoglycolate dehydrogenase, LDH2 family [Thalassospira xiamenensis]